MSQSHALKIANEWKYEGIYSFDDMTEDMEDYEEFIDEQLRNQNNHYEAIIENELAGFFCVIQEGESLEIGLRLRPDLCGKGLGKEFLNQILDFIGRYYQAKTYILNAALFNQRAIRLYHAFGFLDEAVITRRSNGGTYEFLALKKNPCGFLN